MSYILDALKKSDQQRRLGGVPGLPAAAVVAAVPERSPLLLQGLLALTLIIATVTTIAWLRPWTPVPAVTAISAVQALPPPAQSPQPQIAPAVLPQAPAVLAAEAPRLAAAPATVMPAAVVAPVAAVAPRKPSASPVPDTYLPAPAARPARAALAKADDSAGKPPADEAPRSNAIASSALPASIRKQLPPLTVAVHAYSDTAQERLVSINGRMLREGDTLAPDLRLEQITPEGMIFTFRGYRFQRAAQ